LNDKAFDTKLSGSTVCTILFDGTRLHVANAGDSRAIRVKYFPSKEKDTVKVLTEALSIDHKPELVEEQKRIL